MPSVKLLILYIYISAESVSLKLHIFSLASSLYLPSLLLRKKSMYWAFSGFLVLNMIILALQHLKPFKLRYLYNHSLQLASVKTLLRAMYRCLVSTRRIPILPEETTSVQFFLFFLLGQKWQFQEKKNLIPGRSWAWEWTFLHFLHNSVESWSFYFLCFILALVFFPFIFHTGIFSCISVDSPTIFLLNV